MKKTDWIHVQFWFKGDGNWFARKKGRQNGYLGIHEEKVFYWLLRRILLDVMPFIKRKFFLFEPNPHCFFALEVRDDKYIPKIKQIVNTIQEAHVDEFKFIKRVAIRKNTPDDDNGSGFLNIMDTVTEYNLFLKDNRLSHILHCIVNNGGFSRDEENKFYKLMGETYK